MTRLPTPGQDDGVWGDILNEFLSKSHDTDGTLKTTAITEAGGATRSYVDSTVASGAPDATSSVKGLVQLTGDLGGTATSPTVPGLAAKQPLDTDLTAIAGLTPVDNDVLQRKSGTWTNRTIAQLKADLGVPGSGDYLDQSANLTDVPDKAAARVNLGAMSRGLRTYDLVDYGFFTDIKASIEAALAQARLDGGGDIVFPGGTWVFDGWTGASVGSVLATNNVRYIGADKGTILKLSASAPTANLLLPIKGSKLTVEGLGFDTSAIQDSTSIRVLGGSERVTVTDCSFDVPSTGGIYIQGTVTDLLASNNHFHGARWGILTQDAATVSRLSISGNTFVGGTIGDAIEINVPSGTATDITIANNTINGYAATSGSGIGIGIAHAERVTIQGNTVSNVGLDAIHIEDSANYVSVIGNTITAASRSGISLLISQGVSGDTNRTGQVTVIGNTVQGCGTGSGNGAIIIEGANGNATSTDFIIANNIVRGNGRAGEADYGGIFLGYQSLRAIVTGNIVSNTIGSTKAAGIYASETDAYIAGNYCYDDQGTPTQKYGVYVTGSGAVVRVRDNKYSGNVTATQLAASGSLTDLTEPDSWLGYAATVNTPSGTNAAMPFAGTNWVSRVEMGSKAIGWHCGATTQQRRLVFKVLQVIPLVKQWPAIPCLVLVSQQCQARMARSTACCASST